MYATTPPPLKSRRVCEVTQKFCYYPPPTPLNSDGFRRRQKMSATTPPLTESRRLSDTTEKFCYYPPPPPLNRDGFRRSQKISATTPPPTDSRRLALDTKGAPSLGKSWICDCTLYHRYVGHGTYIYQWNGKWRRVYITEEDQTVVHGLI